MTSMPPTTGRHPHDVSDTSGPAARGVRGSAVPVVELADAVRIYDGAPPIVALDRVDLTIRVGEFVSIVGPSGSGKSTLLNIMGTLDRPTSGRVRIGGTDIAALSDRRLCALRARHLGFVFQSFHLIESASALANVANGILYRGVGRRRRVELAGDALALVGLADRVDSKPSKLSGGQRQRVAIARAIVGRPSLVLADEPTGNLDSATSAEILRLLTDLNQDHGVTVAVITHDDEVASATRRRVVVKDGRIEQDGANP